MKINYPTLTLLLLSLVNASTTLAQNSDANSARLTEISTQTSTKSADIINSDEEEPPEVVNGYEVMDWEKLLPASDLNALENDAPDISHQSTTGFKMKDPAKLKDEKEKRYYEALISTNINASLNNKKVRMPGFIVPLEYDENKRVTEFFLVPYVGACIHVPPPPPNQLIYVIYKKGLALTSMSTAYWVDGTLTTEELSNKLGRAAYKLQSTNVELYQ